MTETSHHHPKESHLPSLIGEGQPLVLLPSGPTVVVTIPQPTGSASLWTASTPRNLGFWKDSSSRDVLDLSTSRNLSTSLPESSLLQDDPLNPSKGQLTPQSMFIAPLPPHRSDTRTFRSYSRDDKPLSIIEGPDRSLNVAEKCHPHRSNSFVISKVPSEASETKFDYPTWSLLGRNSCPDLGQSAGVGRTLRDLRNDVDKRIYSYEKTRAHSQPPPARNAKIAQRSSHAKIVAATRRGRSLGRTTDISAVNHIRPRRTRGDDFRSLELLGIPAMQACFSSEEKKAAHDLHRQSTRSFAFFRRQTSVRVAHRMPMDHPSFVWSLFMNNQSPLSRLKLLRMLAQSQIERSRTNRHTLEVCPEADILTVEKNAPKMELPAKATGDLILLQGRHSKARIGKPYNEDACYAPMGPYPGNAFPQGSEMTSLLDSSFTDECDNDPETTAHYPGTFFILADGVGEWSQYGINSSVFSRTIVDGIRSRLARWPGGASDQNVSSEGNSPEKQVLIESIEKAFETTQSEDAPIFGACTIIAGILSEGEKLYVANIGDSAVMQLRRDPIRRMRMNVLAKTPTTEHGFNTPKQLVNCPGPQHYDDLYAKGQGFTVESVKTIRERAEGLGQSIGSDPPSEASFTVFTLFEGDLLICASDGLFDNLFDDEIAQLCSYALSPYEDDLFEHIWQQPSDTVENLDATLSKDWFRGRLAHPNAMEPPQFTRDPLTAEKRYYTNPGDIAQGLVEAAYARGLDPAASVPFGRCARRAGFADLAIGGKVDDTTCIVSWVTADMLKSARQE